MNSPIVVVLEEHGLPAFTNSPQSYGKALQKCIDGLAPTHGNLLSVVSRTIGQRTQYHFAIFDGTGTPVEVAKAAVEPEAEESTSKPKSKRAKAA